jgi:hypothetical protein
MTVSLFSFSFSFCFPRPLIAEASFAIAFEQPLPSLPLSAQRILASRAFSNLSSTALC